jgi:uncharacterized protein (TIGR03084 family)
VSPPSHSAGRRGHGGSSVLRMDDVVTALAEQVDELRSMVGGLDEDGLAAPSACEGWSVADVLLHLAQTNELAVASVRGDLAEAAERVWGQTQAGDVDAAAGEAVAAERGAGGAEVRARWDRSAQEMVASFAAADPAARVPWVAGDMAARSLATTRIAETWIHTGDIAEGLSLAHEPSEGIRHIVYLVHRTLPYAFARAGRAPVGSIRFEVTAPGGETWAFGDVGADTVVTGPAVDLCRVAGQRVDAADTALAATGPDGADVLALMRTFA